ncbi:MAG: 50S ribosomal protein L6 [Planctomycetota bacterium]|nr:50S ribosomal protein L6 [Planctomycetota bacterium]MDA1178250.1 50S ribosomal protein L6 [Planctomycetota bacterium]
MSRIGLKPVVIPKSVKVQVNGATVLVEGPKGKLETTFRPEVKVVHEPNEGRLRVERKGDERTARALHGLTRSLIANMVEGVANGYSKKLEIVGVGYLAAVQKNTLQLRVGFANEIHKTIPVGLTVVCPDQTHVLISGCDKQQVGQFAAEIRSLRKPEPYKGKGVRYDGEVVKLKPGKAANK